MWVWVCGVLRAARKVPALALGIPQWPPGLTEPSKVTTHTATHRVGKGLTVRVATLLPKQKVMRHMEKRTMYTAEKESHPCHHSHPDRRKNSQNQWKDKSFYKSPNIKKEQTGVSLVVQ